MGDSRAVLYLSPREEDRNMNKFIGFLFWLSLLMVVNMTLSIFPTNNIDPFGDPSDLYPASYASFRRRCPLCDSSVYSYCTDKLFHDSCCCHNPNNPYDRLPYQCQFADCSFLHANSCQEHKLITACCCTNYLVKK